MTKLMLFANLIADYALFDQAIDTYEAGLAPETYVFEMLADIYFESTNLIDYPTASRPTFLSTAWKDGFQDWLTGWVAHMQSRGMGYDEYYLSPYDERLDTSVYEIAKLIKETDPQIRVQTARVTDVPRPPWHVCDPGRTLKSPILPL